MGKVYVSQSLQTQNPVELTGCPHLTSSPSHHVPGPRMDISAQRNQRVNPSGSTSTTCRMPKHVPCQESSLILLIIRCSTPVKLPTQPAGKTSHFHFLSVPPTAHSKPQTIYSYSPCCTPTPALQYTSPALLSHLTIHRPACSPPLRLRTPHSPFLQRQCHLALPMPRTDAKKSAYRKASDIVAARVQV